MNILSNRSILKLWNITRKPLGGILGMQRWVIMLIFSALVCRKWSGLIFKHQSSLSLVYLCMEEFTILISPIWSLELAVVLYQVYVNWWCRQIQVYSNRAACYTKLGALPEGLKDAEKCIELDPAFPKGYSRKGAIQFFMKEYDKALETYQEGLKHDENNQELMDGVRRYLRLLSPSCITYAHLQAARTHSRTKTYSIFVPPQVCWADQQDKQRWDKPRGAEGATGMLWVWKVCRLCSQQTGRCCNLLPYL